MGFETTTILESEGDENMGASVNRGYRLRGGAVRK